MKILCPLDFSRYVCLGKRDIFCKQMRYNLPCGRLRYDINPPTPRRAYRIEDISHATAYIANPCKRIYIAAYLLYAGMPNKQSSV